MFKTGTIIISILALALIRQMALGAEGQSSAYIGSYAADSSWRHGPRIQITDIDAAGNVSGEISGLRIDRGTCQQWRRVFGPQLASQMVVATFRDSRLTITMNQNAKYDLVSNGSGGFSGAFTNQNRPEENRQVQFLKTILPPTTGNQSAVASRTTSLIGRYMAENWENGPRIYITGVDELGNLFGKIQGFNVVGSCPDCTWRSWVYLFAEEPRPPCVAQAKLHGSTLSIVLDESSRYDLWMDGAGLSGKFTHARRPDRNLEVRFVKSPYGVEAE